MRLTGRASVATDARVHRLPLAEGDTLLLGEARLQQLRNQVLDSMARFYDKSPDEPGVNAARLRRMALSGLAHEPRQLPAAAKPARVAAAGSPGFHAGRPAALTPTAPATSACSAATGNCPARPMATMAGTCCCTGADAARSRPLRPAN